MAEQLKLMYNEASLKALSNAIIKVYPSFDHKKFLSSFKTKTWQNAELKARVRMTAIALNENISGRYEDKVVILIKANPHIQRGFFSIFLPEFVEIYGQQNWELSMNALGEFTKTSSAEFAIRHFIQNETKRTMERMMEWSKSPDVHLRRLSSEGCRPRLPWGMQLKSFVKDPAPVIRILETLKSDQELYVKKSVANNLNDISKDHPDLVLNLAKKWYGKNEDSNWIVKHALRTLLKKGNKQALKIFGHHDTKGIEVKELNLDRKKLKIGESLSFKFSIENSKKKVLDARIEYAIDYTKSNGTLSRKIFQVKKSKLAPGESIYNRKQRFADLTTRKHYKGKHHLHVLVNGEVKSSSAFHLV